MTVTNAQLDGVVQAWRDYAGKRPAKLKPRDILVKRDLNMYRGLGVDSAAKLVERLVDDRSVATLEMTMGYLYERLLEELGPKKLSDAEKAKPGFRGIDFVQEAGTTVTVVNLKAGLSTGNGDINDSTVNHLVEAKRHLESTPTADDNPLRQRKRKVVMVRAVARGSPRRKTTDKGILWLVGDSMWEHFGGGKGLLLRLSKALSRNPLSYDLYAKEKRQAANRLVNYLVKAGLATKGGVIDWPKLVAEFP